MDEFYNEALYREDMKAFDYILSLSKDGPPTIWAAWGSIIEKGPYL